MMVLVTGASGGLGRAIAVECARRGYDLLLTDIADAPLLQIKQGVERQFGVRVITKACDLTDDGQLTAFFKFIDDERISLDMLLNIAGIDYEGGFLFQPSVNITRIVQVNIEATLKVTHAALERRRKEERFTIINVSSLASQYPIPLKATYAASKRFLLDFSIALAQELKHENVNVLALCPGGLPTTHEALLGIAAQGIWGDLTTNDLGEVARKTITAALKGRRVYIPGCVNGILRILGRLVPNTLVAKLLYKRWKDAQGRWGAIEAGRMR
jgi:short-subunit dehydrogenase